jgi:hypothetical protein
MDRVYQRVARRRKRLGGENAAAWLGKWHRRQGCSVAPSPIGQYTDARCKNCCTLFLGIIIVYYFVVIRPPYCTLQLHTLASNDVKTE